MKEITEEQSLFDAYKINKTLQLNTVNKGEPTDNVLVHGINKEVKFVPRSEFGGGSQSFQDVVTKSAVDMDGAAVASVEDSVDASKKGTLIVGKTDGVLMGAAIASLTSTSVGSYITENGKIKILQCNPDGTIRTELKINEPTVASNIYVPAPALAGDYTLATTQDITLDKAAAAGAIITDKEVVFNNTVNDSKASITEANITISEPGAPDSGVTETKMLINKNSISLSETGFRDSGPDPTLARISTTSEFGTLGLSPIENKTLINKDRISLLETSFSGQDKIETRVLIDKKSIAIEEEIVNYGTNTIGLDGDEWSFYSQQGDSGFIANPFYFAFSEGRHNVSFMVDGPINQTTQVRFNPLGGAVTYEDSFKTINGKSIVGTGNIVVGEAPAVSFKTINGKSIIGTGDIVVGGTPTAATFQEVLNTGKVSTTTGQDHHFQLRSQFYDGGPYHDMIFKRNSIRLEFNGGGYIFDEDGIYPVRNLSSSFGYGGYALSSGGLSLKTNPIGGMATIKADNLTSNYTFQLPGNIEVGGTQTLATTNDIAAYVASRTVVNQTTILLTSADLNTTYPAATVGFRVMALNIPSEKVIYEKIANGWIKTAVLVI
jgi:hypothetical protein